VTGAALVTGGTSGIGLSLANTLVDNGWTVTCVGRRKLQPPRGNMRIASADFSSLQTIRKLVQPNEEPFDLLVMNAGIGTYSPGEGARCSSRDGHELRFQVNYLAHYCLLRMLIKFGRLSANFACVGVITERCSAPDFDDINMSRNYNAGRAYARSKGALGMLCMDIFHGLHAFGEGRALVCDPGSYVPTGMDRPGRPRVTPLASAVMRVDETIECAVSGRARSGDFAILPADVRDARSRQTLRAMSVVLAGPYE
jgi:NAD(P)-dependent dehydrogenase (short-subunit alcohol dehydrogenase family)